MTQHTGCKMWCVRMQEAYIGAECQATAKKPSKPDFFRIFLLSASWIRLEELMGIGSKSSQIRA